MSFDKKYIDYCTDCIHRALEDGNEKRAARFEGYLYSDFIYHIASNAPEEFAALAKEVLKVQFIEFKRPSANDSNFYKLSDEEIFQRYPDSTKELILHFQKLMERTPM